MAHILMVAAENGALPGGKVGGIGDVVREIPPALAKRDCQVSVITPAYGVFASLDCAIRVAKLEVSFAGEPQTLELFELNDFSDTRKVRHYVIDHPLFSSCGAGRIYCDDPPGRPFESDASKFALFSLAVAEAVTEDLFTDLDVLHLHDWHAAFVLILRHYDPAYAALKKLRSVYSIHNLAIQGIRPFANQQSSLESWYPDLIYDRKQLIDPTWPDCVNPMAAAIRLADAVHTVSPNYAREILLPGDIANGVHGGEGLDEDLRAANGEQRLFGILNGCEYPQPASGPLRDWSTLMPFMRAIVPLWISRSTTVASAHFIAHQALAKLSDERPKMLLTSVGRITDQKIGLMRERTSGGVPALHAALSLLGNDGMMIMVGSGDPDYEQFLCETMLRHDNFIFLRGYSDELAAALYLQGDLFFMPSSFEPCGISQMLAMRAGQPCLVHKVGGLGDTVKDRLTGFSFSGTDPASRADALIKTLQRALALYLNYASTWKKMRKAAAAERFSWADSIDAYLRQLYSRKG
jgi:starch synthase